MNGMLRYEYGVTLEDSLVHRRNDNADPATVDSVEAAGQDQGRVSAGGPDTGGNAGERRS